MATQARPTAEERLSRLEGAYEQVNERLNDMTQAVTSLREETNSFRAEVNSRFNNLYVIMGGSWVSLMAAIIASNFLD